MQAASSRETVCTSPQAGSKQHFLTMLWWEKEFPEVGWAMALCLELLNTSGWAREGAWDDSRFVDSFSMEEGVFPSSTARSILDEERRRPAELIRSCHIAFTTAAFYLQPHDLCFFF